MISILVEVAHSAGIGLNAAQLRAIPEMIAAKLIAPTGDDVGPFKITPLGQTILDEQGVGANES
jgi:hypothetical protein